MSRTSASVFVAERTVRGPARFAAVRALPAIRALLAAIPLLLLSASCAGAATVVRTSPHLTPPYSAGTPDYTVRCSQASPVTIDVHAARGTRVTLDGGRHRAGSFKSRRSLTPGQAFGFEVRKGRSVRRHVARCVPADFPSWTVKRLGKPEVKWIAFAPNVRQTPPPGAPYSVIADSHGVPVWWRRADVGVPLDTTVLSDGTVVWGEFGGAFSQAMFTRIGLDGTALGTLTTVGVGADSHDFQQLPNGNYLMIAYLQRSHVDLTSIGGPPDANVLDGEVQEISPTGQLVWSWRTSDHIGLDETKAVGLDTTAVPPPAGDGNTFDLVHVNSVEPDGNSVLISGRHVDAVYRVRMSDGKILWKLGGTQRPESLRLTNDRGPDGQHDARHWPDGTVSFHDNGTFGNHVPRVARYRIDPKRRTATLVEQVTYPTITSSFCCGSARRLPHSHWLVDWGGRSLITEIAPGGRHLLTLKVADHLFSYRAQPVPGTVLTRAKLHAAMDAQYRAERLAAK
jgi:Arylsulfotransferase (ASST)